MPSGDFRPPSAEWQQGYDAGYREAQQDVAAARAPSPDAPGPEVNSQSLRVAAQRVLDDWNRIGAQGDGYRALRAALAASGDTPRDGLREALEAIAKAEATVTALCEGKQRWVMNVPAEPDRDPDLVISDALAKARAVITGYPCIVRPVFDGTGWYCPVHHRPASVCASLASESPKEPTRGE